MILTAAHPGRCWARGLVRRSTPTGVSALTDWRGGKGSLSPLSMFVAARNMITTSVGFAFVLQSINQRIVLGHRAMKSDFYVPDSRLEATSLQSWTSSPPPCATETPLPEATETTLTFRLTVTSRPPSACHAASTTYTDSKASKVPPLAQACH